MEGQDAAALGAALRKRLGQLSQLERMETALKEIRDLNPLRNDFDIYIDHLCEWGLNLTEEKPNKEEYGLGERIYYE